MSDKIILRVFSKAGRSRVEISNNKTFLQLKTELSERLSIPVNALKLFTDQAMKKPVAGRDTGTIQSLGLKNGDILHVGNQNVELASVAAIQSSAAEPATSQTGSSMIDTTMKGTKGTFSEQNKAPKCRRCHGSTQKCINCMSAAQTNNAEGKKEGDETPEEPRGRCNHASSSRCPNCIGQTASVAPTKPRCHHGPNQKCPNCLDEDAGMIADRKHTPFDGFIAANKRKCAKSHASNQRCQNCTFSQDQRYTVDYDCKFHPPYPAGSCQRCIPQSVVLKRQAFRHLDYVSFMNFKELQKFVDHWRRGSCMEQRIGYLYGYFSEDPNYPLGIRVNVEAIYEPPQISEMGGFIELDDPGSHKVDMIAAALGLERVGSIFTKVDQDTILSADEVKRAAEFQQLHSFDHPMGLKVPKFVTVVVGLKGEDVEVNCYMVSDQCQALVHSNVFGHSDDRKKLVVRTPNHDEMVPAFLQEGASVTDVAPEFFVVNVAHGQPSHTNDFNILKIYDFPVKNRDQPASRAEFKGYLNKYSSDPTEKLFANFQLLLYLAELMDVDTALTCSQHVQMEIPLDEDLMQLFRAQ